LKLSQRRLSLAAGCSSDVVNLTERDKTNPALDTVERIATALGVSPCWLAYGNEGPLVFKQKRSREEERPDEDDVKSGSSHQLAGLYRGVAARLREARELRGLSARALAKLLVERLGEEEALSVQQILNTEAAATVPKVDSVEKLALVLEVSPCWLAYGMGEGPGGGN
jgi:transcriptional regulator with XRE-family HTH domain